MYHKVVVMYHKVEQEYHRVGCLQSRIALAGTAFSLCHPERSERGAAFCGA
jgi:hypothetical protein